MVGMKSYSSCFTTPDRQAHYETGTVEFQGRTFEAGGAMVSPTHAVGYPHEETDGRLTMRTWGGIVLGPASIVARWPVRSWVGSTMYQIEATIAGRRYTGRGFGPGMVWRGKRKRAV